MGVFLGVLCDSVMLRWWLGCFLLILAIFRSLVLLHWLWCRGFGALVDFSGVLSVRVFVVRGFGVSVLGFYIFP